MEDLALILVVAVALGFDFTNGFDDAANSIATVVATRVLSPRYAVMWAAFFNFLVEDDLAYVPRSLTIAYVVLAVVCWLDWRTNNGT